MMGTKSLSRLKSHIDFINTPFVTDFVYGNMLRGFCSLRVFICNYVLYSFGFVLRYIFRFLQLGDDKDELNLIVPQADGTERNQCTDSEIDGFQELTEFLFWSEDFHVGSEEREVKTECSVLMETSSVIHEDSIHKKVLSECSDIVEDGNCGETDEDGFASMEIDSENSVVHEVGKENEEVERLVSMETESCVHEGVNKRNEDETKSFVSMIDHLDLHHDSTKREEEKEETSRDVFVEDVHEEVDEIDKNETENSVSMENSSSLNEDNEIENSVSKEDESNVHNSKKRVENEEDEIETRGDIFVEHIQEDMNEIDENETEHSVSTDNVTAVNEETETESSVSKDDRSNVHGDSKNIEEKQEETHGPLSVETDSVTTTSKCQYLSGKDICGFIEQPTTLTFSFREFYMGPDVSSVSNNAHKNSKIIVNKEFSEIETEGDPIAQEEKEYSVQDTEDFVHETEDSVSDSPPFIPLRFESEAFGGTDSSDEDCFIFNENSVTSDSESESSSSSGLIWGNSNKLDDSIEYQFFGGKREGFESEILKLMMREEREEYLEEKQPSSDSKVSDFRVNGIYSEDGYLEMEPGKKDLKSLNMNGFGVVKDQKEGSHYEETKWEDELSGSESDEDDYEWEHDDLVEQLKMELRNSRQGGLATILEEEEEEAEEEEQEQEQVEEVIESPKVVQDLNPLKIEEKMDFKDQIDEIQKVYKSYEEKMRKLDILNYQTMHALGLLQLKDPQKSISIPKSITPSAVISQNLWPRKASKNKSDPLLKFVHELHRELELVYVGQVCLSWEILCWQHKKALELQQYESEGSHRYNLVAGEFQLFQVLVQRFVENEPFQGGPRVQNYVKNRCVIRNLLQVPAIKDDSKGNEEENAIASGRLAVIIKESMRVFWEFVRADKDYGNVILKVSHQIGPDLKDPAISGLLVDIRTQLQKKEKRLKDIVRTGNCIVKKFQKHHEDQLDHEQLVAQVGLRLISRVMNMSKLRKEQIIWCHEKLHRIKFLSRKIVHVEPSFLLFPC